MLFILKSKGRHVKRAIKQAIREEQGLNAFCNTEESPVIPKIRDFEVFGLGNAFSKEKTFEEGVMMQ